MSSLIDEIRTGHAKETRKRFVQLKAEIDCIMSLAIDSTDPEDRKLVTDCEGMRRTVQSWLNMAEQDSIKEGW